MKVFITGGTGQVGTELIAKLKEQGQEILAPNRGLVDLKNVESLIGYLSEHRPDIVINAAAYTAVDKAEQEQTQAYALNEYVPALLAVYCREQDIPLVHYSSDYVYAGSGSEPRTENSPTSPLSVYGKSKLAGDNAILNSGCRGIILRTSWVYSQHGHNFMKTMLRLAKEKDSLSIVNDQIGAPTSAALIAKVTCELLPGLLRDKGRADAVHLAPNGETSWHGFATEIFKQAKKLGEVLKVTRVKGIPTREYPTPAARPLNSRLSITKLESLLGKKLPQWQDGLSATLADFLKKQN